MQSWWGRSQAGATPISCRGMGLPFCRGSLLWLSFGKATGSHPPFFGGRFIPKKDANMYGCSYFWEPSLSQYSSSFTLLSIMEPAGELVPWKGTSSNLPRNVRFRVRGWDTNMSWNSTSCPESHVQFEDFKMSRKCAIHFHTVATLPSTNIAPVGRYLEDNFPLMGTPNQVT